MNRGAFTIETVVPTSSHSASGEPAPLAIRFVKLSCVVLAGAFLANCAAPQTARNNSRSKEIGAFPQSKYGPASPRVVADGDPVPKGGGRELIGKSYSVAGKRYTPYAKPVGYTVVGTASWYGEAFHGRKTANGEIYDRHGISAAHPTMPLPAYARVSNTLNGRSIIVRVNDRGPYHGGRVMDLSQRAADALAFRHLGTARVKVEYLGQASLGGSDDGALLATLRTDGQPAALPGQSAPTLFASAAPSLPSQSPRADLDQSDDEPAPIARPVVQPAPTVQPVVRAYTQPQVASVADAAPAVLTRPTAVRNAPLPPGRPFDLDTIANAGSPVPARVASPVTPLPPSRSSIASLYAAPERPSVSRVDAGNPVARDVVPQKLRSLSKP